MRDRLHCALRLFAALTVLITGAAASQTYPTRTVRLVVGFPPGGAVDILARIVAPKLSERWGQQVVVDNRPGAGTRIAAEITAKAAPDGYTLLMITSAHAVGPALYEKLPYHAIESFSAVSLVASTPLVLLTHTSLPVRSLKELVALAKARPGQLNYASSGIGAPPHLAAELFKRSARINIVHVPYKGSGPAFADLIGGQVELMFAALPGSLPYIRAGKLRPIALTSAKRSKAVPDLPTIAELGFPGYEVTNWYGVLGPSGVDRKIIEHLNAEIAAVLQMRDVAEAIVRVGAEPVSSTPQEFEAYLRSEVAKWTKLITEAGIRVE
jgi:tripartite-type tricarboxylate transporter receptor subunit TctC